MDKANTKKTKTKLKFFTIPEWEKEQNYLAEQHLKGWKFVNVRSFGFYHFEKCEPQAMVYQLDYNPDGIAHKESYIQLFQDCGWEYLQDFGGYSYFRKAAAEMDGTEEIFCDASSRLEMMNRVFKGRMLPLIAILLLCIIPQFILQQSHPDSFIRTSLLLLFIVLAVFYLIVFLLFGIHYWKFWHSTLQE